MPVASTNPLAKRKKQARAFAIKKYDADPRFWVSSSPADSKVDLTEPGGAWVRVWRYFSSQDLADDASRK